MDNDNQEGEKYYLKDQQKNCNFFENLMNELELQIEKTMNEFEVKIEELTNKSKTLIKEILGAPKWGVPIIITFYGIGFILCFPGLGILFMFCGIKIVGHLDKHISEIIEKTKEKINRFIN